MRPDLLAISTKALGDQVGVGTIPVFVCGPG
jgi:hypothetical protein